jgi:hypothetical protein
MKYFISFALLSRMALFDIAMALNCSFVVPELTRAEINLSHFTIKATPGNSTQTKRFQQLFRPPSPPPRIDFLLRPPRAERKTIKLKKKLGKVKAVQCCKKMSNILFGPFSGCFLFSSIIDHNSL